MVTSHAFPFSNQELTFILAFDIARHPPPQALRAVSFPRSIPKAWRVRGRGRLQSMGSQSWTRLSDFHIDITERSG